MTNLYKVEFYIDTGYEFLKKEAVVDADSNKDAIEKIRKWISPKLHGECFAELEKASVEKIENDGTWIVYQNVFKS